MQKQVQDPQTIGVSPKAISATLTALLAPYIVGLLARLVGLDLDVGLATAIAGPIILAGVVAISTALARVGLVEIEDDAT